MTANPFPATGRVAVVTGAGGAIGRAIADRLADNADIVHRLDVRRMTDDNRDGLIHACDLTDENAVSSAFASIEERTGPVQLLVHAAGITGAGSVTDESPATWRRIIDTNLTSAYLVAREAIPQMRRAGGGAIVLIASVNARFGGSALSGPAYAASKGGLVTLARFLAREHAVDGITSNSVAPGPHATPMWDALDPTMRSKILAMIPGDAGPGDPLDLAATVAHLCSPAARYINGATIDINGGQWMG
ncbi:MAG: 3-oxoacyl-acyl-carrier protein reductase [Acidimicrobiaceae bacterium]|nr:MAG: 3-oxoacyl-acyl-carrier protein reductase [Acidimicrobiaceae bacterium]